ncbi:MAG: glycerol-3-phosphate acyltransferase [Actinomycetota bacterium]|nr:glycerol-3-phosphate acyltransferase [Actinomycetota bacterium]
MGIELLYKTLIVIASYLFGSFPTAYIVHRIKKGDDIRKYGSGNVGGTNVARTLGAGYGATTIIADMAKGLIPIIVIYFIYPADLILLAVVSVAVVIGHDFPAYIKFKGGKGTAASIGVVMGVSFLPFVNIADSVVWIKILPFFIIFGVWAIIFVIFRIVSAASLSGAIVSPLAFYFTGFAWPVVIAAICWSILTFITHRENIKRLIHKEEKKL